MIRGAGTGAKLGTIEGFGFAVSLVVVEPTPVGESGVVSPPTAEIPVDVLVPGVFEV